MKSTRTFTATVVRVVDGDTANLAVRLKKLSRRFNNADLGFSVYIEDGWLVLHYAFRFAGCNAAEHGTSAGDAAKEHLKTILVPGLVVTIDSISNDKYSRYDARILLPSGEDLIAGLIRDQWAASWNGSGAKPLPPWPRTVP